MFDPVLSLEHPFHYGSLTGQQQALRIVKADRQKGQVAHARLIHAESGLGMELLATAFARALLCQAPGDEACERCSSCQRTARLDHPDLKLVLALPSAAGKSSAGASSEKAETEDPTAQVAEEFARALESYHEMPFDVPALAGARQILVGQARHVKHWAYTKSFEGGRRVCLIMDAERMGTQAQNALLKLLEEPPDDMVLLLCSSQPEGLLPTIHSRCQQLRLRSVPVDELGQWLDSGRDAAGRGRELAQMAGGNPGRALHLARSLAQDAAEEGGIWSVPDFVRCLLMRKVDALHARIMAMDNSRDREALSQFIAELQDWIMDGELISELGSEDAALRLKRPLDRERLERMQQVVRIRNRQRIMEALMEASRQVRANINVFSLLTVLAQRMRKEFEAVRQA